MPVKTTLSEPRSQWFPAHRGQSPSEFQQAELAHLDRKLDKRSAAEFSFYLSAAASKTVDAWWTAGTNRSLTAPFVAFNAQGTKLGTVSVNQTVNGGKWVQLGTYNFTAGWNKVVLSRWAPAGQVVIADAIRVR